jgi:uroporphyrin-III C-methyltransferase/precorrin-2 dehydrogenase/sirohydrochlorin ferrochelatase
VYMGGQTLPGLAAHFIEAGMAPDMPAVAVENASLPGQRILKGTIGSLPGVVVAAAPSGPVLVLIGQALDESGAVDEIVAQTVESHGA